MNYYSLTSLIVTAGASLVNIFKTTIEEAKQFNNDDKIAKKILNQLFKLDDPLNDRNFGAEINSTYAIMKGNYLSQLQNLYLIISDTKEGELVGKILKLFFENNPFDINFNMVKVLKIKGLNDKKVKEFKNAGLRNLVVTLADIIKQHEFTVGINATAGYKAQIALAQIIGQVMNIPVFYRFENFPTIITMPPLPIDMDKEIFEKYKELFIYSEAFEIIEKSKFFEILKINSMEKIPEMLRSFFEYDQEGFFLLTPMGEIYLEKTWNVEYEELEKYEWFTCGKDYKYNANKEGHSRIMIDKEAKPILDKVMKLKPVKAAKTFKTMKKTFSQNDMVKSTSDTINMNISTTTGTLKIRIVLCQNYGRRIFELIKRKIEETVGAGS